MNKVKVTAQVAKAIEDSKHYFNLAAFVKFVNKDSGFASPWSKILRREFLPEDKDVLIQAMFYGYEVEPEFEVGDVVIFDYKDAVRVIGEIVDIEVDEFTFAKINDPKYPVPQKINVSELRLATPSEIKQEKERRWWKSHGREVWELRKGDVFMNLKHSQPNPFIVNENTIRNIKSNRSNEHLKIVCFVENRLDVNAK